MNIRKLRQLLRLLLTTNYSNRRIAQLAGISPNTVRTYRNKRRKAAMTLAELEQHSDDQLLKQLNPIVPVNNSKRQPDWAYVHHLMQEKHQTLIQLWEEYRSIEPTDALCYSQFTHWYRHYIKSIDVSMRQYYAPGEVCFVDFAGKRIPWIDQHSGQTHYAEMFVGVMGYSQLVFAKALSSQKLEDWLEAHQAMFAYFSGVPQLVVPDNLKSAVTRPGKFPEVNRSYQELAEHYGFVVEPARVRRPQDKSLAEIGVLLVTRWITVVLRRRRFFSIAEINQAIVELLEQLNQRPFRRYQGNRRERFEHTERAALSPLPTKPFNIGRWIHQQKVNRDYHIYVYGHAYSVPYELTGQSVDIKICQNMVEIYFHHQLVAMHMRSNIQGGATTENSHRPKSHQAYAAQSKAHFMHWAKDIGEHSLALISAQFDGVPDCSLQGCKACSQLQKLARKYGQMRFERACQCACEIQSLTVSSVRSILQCRLDEPLDEAKPVQGQLPLHHNVRGARYYLNGGQ
ncbi:IS21 family transposase [Shewanella marisflavi]|uniref:IS21 family transposase n=1 Tax=Shewanella marisflavi TaxID=260364 RepID=UPI00200C540A|nr:IS21 family transposase [Shewanella marisflavi]MCL1043686.1 IS21 family transposase [Shewanella marisflavi]